MRLPVLLWVLIASSLLPAPVQGEVPPPDRAAETRALVQRLVLDRAVAVASVQRIADEREEQLFAELAAKDRRLRAEQRTRKAAQTELADVTAERQRLVDQIAARDHQFAAEIGEYRHQVASIADSPDPRKLEALKRYAEGDRAGGYAALTDLQETEDQAAPKAMAKRSAAGWREIAALARDRKDHGEMDTVQVIAVYEKAQSLDPEDAWGWIELRRLYQEAGRLPDARRAAEKALASAQSDRARSAAQVEIGDVLVASGDLAGARERFEEGLEIDERLAASDPSDERAQRDLSIGLDKLGNVLVESGDLAGARARFEASLKISQRLMEANPTSTIAQRDLSDSLNSLGDVLVTSGDLAGARERFEASTQIAERLAAANPSSADAQRDLSAILESLGGVLAASEDLAGARDRLDKSLAIRERLAAADPSSANAQHDLSISLNKLGDLLVASGDLAGARDRFDASLKIRERLAAANPSSANAQRNLSFNLARLGDVLVASGDLAGARIRYEESLKIDERLAASNPSSAEAQRDLIVDHTKLGRLTGDELHWREALRIALDL